ncbi:MAG: phosphomannose isomerase type II C-terminal cupin domain [Candidatus Pacearchaeota archaeon]
MKVVKRPWGLFKQFVLNKKCTVKILELKTGEELSLQVHKKREENWYFLDDAIVQIRNKKRKVHEGDIIKIRKGTPHRIIAGNKKARILEISFGDFNEKDEMRLEDKYGR